MGVTWDDTQSIQQNWARVLEYVETIGWREPSGLYPETLGDHIDDPELAHAALSSCGMKTFEVVTTREMIVRALDGFAPMGEWSWTFMSTAGCVVFGFVHEHDAVEFRLRLP